VYERNLFVKIFTVLLLVLMSLMSVYLLTLALDHVIVRPRKLQPDTVGYSVGSAAPHVAPCCPSAGAICCCLGALSTRFPNVLL
jgi:hypothetical protein